jgi:hypothetical protein
MIASPFNSDILRDATDTGGFRVFRRNSSLASLHLNSFSVVEVPCLNGRTRSVSVARCMAQRPVGTGLVSVKRYITLPDGRRWAVTAELKEIGNFCIQRDNLFSPGIVTHAQVVVPIEGIYEMSDEEIGQQVRALAYHARAALAENHAEHIVFGKKDLYRRWEEFIPYVRQVKPLLLEFEDYRYESEPVTFASEIPHALHLIGLFEKHVERKQKGKVAKRYERQKTAKDYDALFVAIGRRDGFRCAACGIVDNLQLDHILPVTLGGDSSPENLQLLCKSCNLKKGELTTDYRGTSQEDSVN